MLTLDEYLQSILANAESVRSGLTPHVMAMHGEQMREAAQAADAAVEEIKLILESPDPSRGNAPLYPTG